MTLVEAFVRTAKKHGDKLAIVDRLTGQRVTYKNALLRSLILSRKLEKYDPGLHRRDDPQHRRGHPPVVAATMTGRTPVMINYSSGAAQNCKDAQRRLGFRTIITSRALLAKIKCPEVDGMVFLEDIAASVSTLQKITGSLRATRVARARPGVPAAVSRTTRPSSSSRAAASGRRRWSR